MQASVSTAVLGMALVILCAATACADDIADLKIGDAAPIFQATDDQGRPWLSAEHLGKAYMVVFFYPGDFTPGCINQAKSFREHMNQLNYRAKVVGVSGDSVSTHQLFKQAYQLNYTLLADADGRLARQFGVPIGPGGTVTTKDAAKNVVTLKRALTAQRWTFIIGLDGKIIYKNTRVNPLEDSKQVATVLDNLDKK